MNHEKAQSIEDVAHRVQVLVIVVVILAAVLLAFMVVECALLTYSLYKKRGIVDAKLDSVVVKDKKKKASSSKSVSASKKRPDKPKKANKKKSSKSSKASSKTSKSSAAGLSSKKKKSSSKKDAKQKSQNSSAESTKKFAAQRKMDAQLKTASDAGSKFDTTSAGTNTFTQIAHIPPQFPPKKFSKKQRDVDTTTASQIANLPSQFGGSSTIRDRDVTTEQQIAEIPPQFEDPKTARSTRDIQLSSDQLQEITAQVLSHLALAQPKSQLVTAHSEVARSPNGFVTPPLAPPELLQAPPEVPKPVVQQQFPTPVYAGKGPAESTYLMDVGQNGETLNVISPSKEIATNSLIINAQNAASNDPAKKDSNGIAKPSS